MSYKNKQLDDSVLAEVTLVCMKVSQNVGGVRITVSPTSEEVQELTELTHVLDIDDFSFFYNNEDDALSDQAKLCMRLRERGATVSKVIKQNPISILSK